MGNTETDILSGSDFFLFFFQISKNQKPVPFLTVSKNFFRSCFLKCLLYFKSARPKVFNALSTISIAHAERDKYACKVASWKQNHKIKKYQFSYFSIKPKEISIHKEYSSHLYYPCIT